MDLVSAITLALLQPMTLSGPERDFIYRGRQHRLLTNLCSLSLGGSLSLHPLPPSLQGSQAREEGETENDRERRKRDWESLEWRAKPNLG